MSLVLEYRSMHLLHIAILFLQFYELHAWPGRKPNPSPCGSHVGTSPSDPQHLHYSDWSTGEGDSAV